MPVGVKLWLPCRAAGEDVSTMVSIPGGGNMPFPDVDHGERYVFWVEEYKYPLSSRSTDRSRHGKGGIRPVSPDGERRGWNRGYQGRFNEQRLEWLESGLIGRRAYGARGFSANPGNQGYPGCTQRRQTRRPGK